MTGGKLFAIGCGPGASDLITVRATRILATLDIIYIPTDYTNNINLLLSIINEYSKPDVEIVEVINYSPFLESCTTKDIWNETANYIIKEINAGKQIGFITSCDPMLFNSWLFLLKCLGDPDWVEVIPGINMFTAAAASAYVALANGEQSLAILNGNSDGLKLYRALENHDVIIIINIENNIVYLKKLLLDLSLLDHAIIVENISLSNETTLKLRDMLTGHDLAQSSVIIVNKSVYN